MDGGGRATGPIGTRDAVVEVAYAVGALVRVVQTLTAGLDNVTEAIKGGGSAPAHALAAAEAASTEAKRTADTSIASVAKVLEAMGETRPSRRARAHPGRGGGATPPPAGNGQRRHAQPLIGLQA